MTLDEEVEKLRGLVKQFGEEVARLEAENAQLRAENTALRELLQKQGSQPGKPPSFVKANREQKVKQPRKKRAEKANRGRRREEPTRLEQHALARCPDCGDELVGGSLHYRRQVVEIPEPQPVEVVEHRVEKRWCRRCRRWHWPRVEWDRLVMGQGRVGVRVAGLVGYMRAMLRVPVRTIQQYLATMHRLELSVGEISALCRRVTERLAAVGEKLKAEARASPVAHMDETGWREDGLNGYIWCLATGGQWPVRYYEYHKSRGQPVAQGLLGTFAGHLVTDFYGGYNLYPGPHQRCWVHLSRALHDLCEQHADDAAVVGWALAVKAQYQRALEAVERSQTAQDRQGFYDLLVARIHELALPYAQAEHPCRALAKRLLRHEDELFQFVLHPHVPPDNNLAERALRSLVVQRKISGGSRSPQGSKTRMALASLFETWKARGLNPLAQCWLELGLDVTPAFASD